MKRLLLIFLLIVMPLQMTWAAASDYCQHETGGSAQHFGHHDHQHQAGEGNKVTKTKLGTLDNDCGYCHHPGASIVTMPVLEMPFVKTTVRADSENSSYLSPTPDRPTKPNWRLPA